MARYMAVFLEKHDFDFKFQCPMISAPLSDLDLKFFCELFGFARVIRKKLAFYLKQLRSPREGAKDAEKTGLEF